MVELDFRSRDEYGSIPKAFLINEFPSYTYFTDVIEHNFGVWIDLIEFDDIRKCEQNENLEGVNTFCCKSSKSGRIVYLLTEDEVINKSEMMWDVCYEADESIGIDKNITLCTVQVYCNYFCW